MITCCIGQHNIHRTVITEDKVRLPECSRESMVPVIQLRLQTILIYIHQDSQIVVSCQGIFLQKLNRNILILEQAVLNCRSCLLDRSIWNDMIGIQTYFKKVPLIIQGDLTYNNGVKQYRKFFI